MKTAASLLTVTLLEGAAIFARFVATDSGTRESFEAQNELMSWLDKERPGLDPAAVRRCYLAIADHANAMAFEHFPEVCRGETSRAAPLPAHLRHDA